MLKAHSIALALACLAMPATLRSSSPPAPDTADSASGTPGEAVSAAPEQMTGEMQEELHAWDEEMKAAMAKLNSEPLLEKLGLRVEYQLLLVPDGGPEIRLFREKKVPLAQEIEGLALVHRRIVEAAGEGVHLRYWMGAQEFDQGFWEAVEQGPEAVEAYEKDLFGQ